MPRRSVWARCSADTQLRLATARSAPGGPWHDCWKTCRSAARPSARASTRTPSSPPKSAAALSKRLGQEFQEADNHPEAQAAKDSFVAAHGEFKTIAVSLTKIANDIRLLGSGPRCSIFELSLPATQPGSSIMPGKVNPVICESVMQVACRVIGNDATVTTAGLGGIGSLFELNVAMPVMIDAFLESVKLLANVSNVFVDKLAHGAGSQRRALPRVNRPIVDDGHVASTAGGLRASRQRWPRTPSNSTRRSASCASTARFFPRRNSTRHSIPCR